MVIGELGEKCKKEGEVIAEFSTQEEEDYHH